MQPTCHCGCVGTHQNLSYMRALQALASLGFDKINTLLNREITRGKQKWNIEITIEIRKEYNTNQFSSVKEY